MYNYAGVSEWSNEQDLRSCSLVLAQVRILSPAYSLNSSKYKIRNSQIFLELFMPLRLFMTPGVILFSSAF